jgi:hypothetical protein
MGHTFKALSSKAGHLSDNSFSKEKTRMSVTIDHEPCEVESLGLSTVGQVLTHASRNNRLVVNMLIDGQQPDLERIGEIRQYPLLGKTLFIETADPRGMALDVLAEVAKQMDTADKLAADACDALRQDKASDAIGRLAGCFTIWQHAQESLLKTAQLLRIDLARVQIDGRGLNAVVGEFPEQLKLIKSCLEDRDYVTLCDILTYETTATSNSWRAALSAMQTAIRGEN